jgi:phospholipase/carboxylesterase
MSLVYAEFLTANTRRLLFLLHGYGADEQDLLSLTNELSQPWTAVAPRAPLALDFGGYAWFGIEWLPDRKVLDLEVAQAHVEPLTALINAKIEEIHPSVVAVVGFSQGAMMALAVADQLDPRVRGIALLSGMRLPFVTDLTRPRRFLVQHGSEDPVVPVAAGIACSDWLKACNDETIYHEYPMGHGISPASFRDLDAWLHHLVEDPASPIG